MKNGGLPSKGEAILAVNNEFLLKQWILSLNLIRDLEERVAIEQKSKRDKLQSKSMDGLDFFSQRSTSSYFCTPQVNSWHVLGEHPGYEEEERKEDF